MTTTENNKKETAVKVTPFARMIAKYYSANGWIDEIERDEYARSLCEPKQNRVVQKMDEMIDGFLDSKLGALFAPNLIKWSQKVSQQLDYQTEEEAIMAEAEHKMLQRVYDKLANR